MQNLFHPEAQAELCLAIDHDEDSEPRSSALVLAVMHLHRYPGYWSERA
jgi:hypothetical protein